MWRSRNACISANFGEAPFRFNLEGMLAEEAEAQDAAVQQCAPPPARAPHLPAVFPASGRLLAALLLSACCFPFLGTAAAHTHPPIRLLRA